MRLRIFDACNQVTIDGSLLGKEACLYSVNVSRTDRNTKRQADCWPRQRTIVPYETRLGQNNRIVRRPQMPLHILLTYVSSSCMTFRAVEQHKAATQRPIIN